MSQNRRDPEVLDQHVHPTNHLLNREAVEPHSPKGSWQGAPSSSNVPVDAKEREHVVLRGAEELQGGL